MKRERVTETNWTTSKLQHKQYALSSSNTRLVEAAANTSRSFSFRKNRKEDSPRENQRNFRKTFDAILLWGVV